MSRIHLNSLCAVLLAVSVATAAAQSSAQSITRPKITGISHLAVYTSDAAAADHFYTKVIGAAKLSDPENPRGVRYAFSDVQFVEVLPLPAGAGINRLDHIAFNTDDAEGLRKYLVSKAWKTPAMVTKGTDGSRWFSVSDPEGNKVQFVQPPIQARAIVAPNVISHRIIHVGVLMHRSAVEDPFYRDVLGFHPYWFGGMKEGRVDWISLQTPDGHDWIEYMLEATHGDDDTGSGLPANMTQNFLGVLNHVALGVASVPDAYNVLEAGNRLEGRHDGRPTKVGLDGKYEFNMYDPDDVRVELMNFKPTEKPCCSPYTGEQPSE
jgi:catechol 2,3-dioxygenase-like lactoylglutathione lyase family enzyme